MTLTPTRQPELGESPDPTELLIKEARRRARRRRLTAGVVLLLVFAMALVVAAGRGGSPSHVVSRNTSQASRTAAVSAHSTTLVVPAGQAVQSVWPVGGQTSWVYTVNETALSHGGQGIEWTDNGGQTWRNATPSGYTYAGGNRFIGGFFALTSTRAWLVVGPLSPKSNTSEAILATSNAGRSWSRVGSLPLTVCTLDFSTDSHGVCTSSPGASNAAPLQLAVTTDGGRTWSKVFDNTSGFGGGGANSADGGLPYSCDKRFSLTPPNTVWATGWCNASEAFLYRSTDNGRHWAQASVAPPTPTVGGGSEFIGPVVLSGRQGAAAFMEGNFSLVYVTRDDGKTFTPVYPPGAERPWTIDIVSPSVWRLALRNQILGTNNAGATWFTVTDNAFTLPAVIKSQRWGDGAPYSLNFTSQTVGWMNWGLDSGSGLFVTRNGGRTWSRVAVPGTSKESA
jgi:photosystem II stability/assembly factor-like uncharacterized protein